MWFIKLQGYLLINKLTNIRGVILLLRTKQVQILLEPASTTPGLMLTRVVALVMLA